MTVPYEVWADIRRTGVGDGRLEIPSKPAHVNTGYGPVRYGVGPEGEPRLLVPCASGRVRILVDQSPRLFVTVASLSGSQGRQSYIDLICRDVALEKVFSELCVEVMRRIEGGSSPEASVIQSIEDFRALLSRAREAEVSREKVLGLVGELFMLNRFVMLGIDAPALWLGPWEQRHDFRGNGQALEVKTSGRSDATRVSIHGVDQLCAPVGGRLFLVHVRFEEESGAPYSVSRIFHQIKKKVTDVQRLREGLSRVGCDDPDSAEWNCHEFSFQSIGVWEVLAGFPRITCNEFSAGKLAPGIASLEYTVDLSAADDYLVNDAELDSFMKGMANA